MRCLYAVVALAGLSLLSGCGGGSGAAGGGDGLVSQSLNGYGLNATYLAKAGVKPQVFGSNSSGAAFTGLSGVAFTSVVTNQVANLANTKIAFSRQGFLWLTDPTFKNLYPITPEIVAGGRECSPAIHPNGRVAAITRYDLATANYQIYFVTLDGLSNTRMTSLVGGCDHASWSPSGSSIVFEGSTSFNQIFSMSSSGGTPTNLSNVSLSDYYPIYSHDGTQIFFWRYNPGPHRYDSYVMNANGSGQTSAQFGSYNGIAGAAFSPGGTYLLVSDGISIYRFNMEGTGGTFLTPPSGEFYTHPCYSPDGRAIVFQHAFSSTGTSVLAVAAYDGSNVQDVTNSSSALTESATPSWGPFPQNRQVIGSGGSLATGASGFIMGQSGPTIESFVAFNAVTPSSSAIVPQASTMTNSVFQIKGDSINKLAFLNDLSLSATVIVPVTGTSAVGGALVSFDSNTGKVVSVVPYSPGAPKMALGKAGSLEYTGRFLGVWDGAGKNLAPSGAGFVSFDAKSGKLLGFR